MSKVASKKPISREEIRRKIKRVNYGIVPGLIITFSLLIWRLFTLPKGSYKNAPIISHVALIGEIIAIIWAVAGCVYLIRRANKHLIRMLEPEQGSGGLTHAHNFDRPRMFLDSAQSDWLPTHSPYLAEAARLLRGAGIVLLWCWMTVIGWIIFLLAVAIVKNSVLDIGIHFQDPAAVMLLSLTGSALVSGFILSRQRPVSAVSFLAGGLLFIITILAIAGLLHTDPTRALGALALFGLEPLVIAAGLLASRLFAKFKR